MTSPLDPAAVANDDPLAEYAAGLAKRLSALGWFAEFDTVRISVARDAWVETLRRARDDEGLPFFSWLSAIDWSRDSAVGEGVGDPDEVDERYEVICRLSSLEDASAAHFVAELPKDDAAIASIVPLFGGAAWHERETAEMFGIGFRGHPNLTKLYLPDGFVGHPLRKSYPLMTREIKPWPGTVDVEPLPSTENVEAGDSGGDA